MNKEDYVSLDVAKMLKEKGFDEPCTASILKDGTLKFYETKQALADMLSIGEIYYEFLAPTLYEAQKWLRTRHKILVTPYYVGQDKYTYHIARMDSENDYCNNNNMYDSFEDALNTGILESLRLI